MQAIKMVVTDLSGNIIEEDSLKPSSRSLTHVVLYKAFEDVTAVTHTHSTHSVSGRKQAEICQFMARPMLMLFLWKDSLYTPIDERRSKRSLRSSYRNVIVETFKERKLEPNEVPGVLVYGHGPFTLGALTYRSGRK